MLPQVCGANERRFDYGYVYFVYDCLGFVWNIVLVVSFDDAPSLQCLCGWTFGHVVCCVYVDDIGADCWCFDNSLGVIIMWNVFIVMINVTFSILAGAIFVSLIGSEWWVVTFLVGFLLWNVMVGAILLVTGFVLSIESIGKVE